MRRAARGEHSRPGAGTAGAACCPAARTGSRCPCAAPACTSIRAPPSSPRTPSTGRRHPRLRGCALPAAQPRPRQLPRRRLCPAAACSSLSQRRVGSVSSAAVGAGLPTPCGAGPPTEWGKRASGKLAAPYVLPATSRSAPSSPRCARATRCATSRAPRRRRAPRAA